MTEVWTPPPIVFPGGAHEEDIPWKVRLSLHEATVELSFLTTEEKGVFTNRSLPQLAIEAAAKKGGEDDDQADPSPSSKKKGNKRRDLLKGLSMELFCGSVIRHLDRCPGVTVHAQTRRGRPYLPALGERADISALFPQTKKSPEFLLLAEVSAMQSVTPEFYRHQIDVAIGHAEDEAEKQPGLLVYVLVINKARMHRYMHYHTEYLDALVAHELTRDGNIRIVPMWTLDFANWAGLYSHAPQTLYFDRHVLLATLDTAYRAMLNPDLPDPLDRTQDMWLVQRMWKASKDLTKKESEVSP